MKIKILYPALCQTPEGYYFFTDTLYESEEKAKEDLQGNFIRLLDEYPGIAVEKRRDVDLEVPAFLWKTKNC